MAKYGLILEDSEREFLTLDWTECTESNVNAQLFVFVFDSQRWVMSTNSFQLHALRVGDDIPIGSYALDGEFIDDDPHWSLKLANVARQSLGKSQYFVNEIDQGEACERINNEGKTVWCWRPLQSQNGLRLRADKQRNPVLTLNPVYYAKSKVDAHGNGLAPYIGDTFKTNWLIPCLTLCDPVVFRSDDCFAMVNPMWFYPQSQT